MRSCVKAFATAVLVIVLGGWLHAQATGPATAYRQLQKRETALRAELDRSPASSARATLLARVRAMSAGYEQLSKTYPTSGYSDNALWQAAMLSADAFWQFGDAFDRRMARHLLDDLGARFPASSLVARIAPYRVRLDKASAPARASRPVPVRSTSVPRPEPTATLTDIRRDVLADAVRITLALEQETVFSTQRLDNPSRLAIDLRNTRVVYALKDARLTYADDVVRQVRLDRQDATRTRVLINLDRAGRFSVYPVYDPYRLVIDIERAGARGTRPATVANAARGVAAAPPPVAAPGTAAKREVAPAENQSSSKASIDATAGRQVPVGTPAAATRTATRDPSGTVTREAPGTTAANGQAPRASARTAPPAAAGRAGYSLSRQLGLGAARVVIDPGHGGHDPGAQVEGLDEAALVLDVALRLEQLLLKIPGVEVVMTRRTSEYIPLEERTAIANRSGADLFLSIHANASPNAAARGIETYFLNFAPNAESEAIAARENAGSSRTMRNLTDIVRAITLNDKIDESRAFAMRMQSALYAQLRRTNKQAKSLGVKQAPFQVLIGATMPSVLAEISFITNEHEGELLKTDSYRAQIASALFDGIMGYQRSLKSEKVVAEK